MVLVVVVVVRVVMVVNLIIRLSGHRFGVIHHKYKVIMLEIPTPRYNQELFLNQKKSKF